MSDVTYSFGSILDSSVQIIAFPYEDEELKTKVEEKFPFASFPPGRPGTIRLRGNKEDQRFVLTMYLGEERDPNTWVPLRYSHLPECLKKINSKVKGIREIAFDLSFFTYEEECEILGWMRQKGTSTTFYLKEYESEFYRYFYLKMKDYLMDLDDCHEALQMQDERCGDLSRWREEYEDEMEGWKIPSESSGKTYNNCSLIEFTKQHTPTGWRKFFEQAIEEEAMDKVSKFLQKEAERDVEIYPPLPEIYTVFKLCCPENIKVVIIGQDPYHTPGAAMGVAFGHHTDRTSIQPSLQNIYKELKNDITKIQLNVSSGDLISWVKQGVFLINTALTVRKGEAKSHGNVSSGWKDFTSQLFHWLNDNCDRLVIVAWGTPAKKFAEIFDDEKHYKVSSVHPSPLSVHLGFFGSKPFSKINRKLFQWGKTPIDWRVF